LKYAIDKGKGYLLLIANGFWKLEDWGRRITERKFEGFREKVLEKVME